MLKYIIIGIIVLLVIVLIVIFYTWYPCTCAGAQIKFSTPTDQRRVTYENSDVIVSFDYLSLLNHFSELNDLDARQQLEEKSQAGSNTINGNDFIIGLRSGGWPDSRLFEIPLEMYDKSSGKYIKCLHTEKSNTLGPLSGRYHKTYRIPCGKLLWEINIISLKERIMSLGTHLLTVIKG